MSNIIQDIINELDTSMYLLESSKQKMLQMRKKLEAMQSSASPKGPAQNQVSDKVLKRLGKRSSIIKETKA